MNTSLQTPSPVVSSYCIIQPVRNIKRLKCVCAERGLEKFGPIIHLNARILFLLMANHRDAIWSDINFFLLFFIFLFLIVHTGIT